MANLLGSDNTEIGGVGVGYKIETHPIKLISEKFSDLYSLILATYAEIPEIEEETQLWLEASDKAQEKLLPNKNWLLEFADFMVMLKIVMDRLAKNFSIEEINTSVNGQFSGSFNSLKEKTLNIAEGNANRNFEAIFVELLSLLKYVNVDLQGEFLANSVNHKIYQNREARFFQEEEGMNIADYILKVKHVMDYLRLIRKKLFEQTHLEFPLQSWITDYFVDGILDWRHSEVAISEFDEKFSAFIGSISLEVYQSLNGGKSKENDRMLVSKMIVAGIKTVSPQKAEEFSPLQYYSPNASLAKDTILLN